MNIHDFFGPNPNRPNHPDFWRLSEIILKLDGRMDAAAPPDKQAVWDDNVARWIDDQASLTYLAMHRSMRVLGISTSGQLQARADEVIRLTTIYMEAFQVGAEFATEHKGE